MSRNRAVFLLAIITALCAAVLMFVNVGFVWLRVLIGIPFVLLLPGQALMLFVDPDGQLGGFEWFALTVGASISLTTLVGMGLAASPLGLNADYLVAGLASVVLLALIAARTPAAPPPRPRPVRSYRYSIRRASLGALALIGCAILVLLLSFPDLGTVATWRGGPTLGATRRVGRPSYRRQQHQRRLAGLPLDHRTGRPADLRAEARTAARRQPRVRGAEVGDMDQQRPRRRRSERP